jgi:ribosomal protein S18 acetylase RimI-like enzyme
MTTRECNQLIKEEVASGRMWFVFQANLEKAINDGQFYKLVGSDGTLEAFAICRKLRSGIISMDKIAVKPESRGTGLGRTLVDRIKSQGLPVRVDVVSSNTDAVRFYEKMGFSKKSEKVLGKKNIININVMMYYP